MAKISIVIPCYNEVRTIDELLSRVRGASVGGWEKEILVVDDASTDGTRELLKKYEDTMRILYLKKNGGKGTAVRHGLAEATGDYILIQDADLEYDPIDIQSLLVPIDAGVADVVYGSRTIGPVKRRGGFIARIGVWLITKLINTLYRLKLTDVWTCYKLFPREASVDFSAGRFESELLFTAALARRDCRFVEVPISYAPRDSVEGKKIRYRDGIYAIIVICMDRIRHV
ncbi:MAG: glycosyltransferase family 2 protein [Candidatus Kaiserbacteria bacterium]|nr:glycosyltransferase family 2 protein [Candidatus Kaiserbacteria bacterium]